MREKLYQRTGIKLTEQQVLLFKKLLRFLIALVIGALILAGTMLLTKTIDPACNVFLPGLDIHNVARSCFETNNDIIPFIGLIAFGLIVGINGLIFIISVLRYAVRLLLNRDFREGEMSQSVSYMESDEREQLLTMRATHRAYMVLNFTLLVGWFLSLLTGHFNNALLLFVIQLIGTLSYRKEVSK